MASKQRYVLFRGEVFRWEEKMPYQPSGVSIEGGFEYDRDSGKIRCHECGSWHENVAAHIIARRRHDARLSPSLDSHPSVSEYRAIHKLLVTAGLTSPEYKARVNANPSNTSALLDYWKTHDRTSVNRVSRSRPGRAEQRNAKGLCPAQTLAAIRTKGAILGRAPGCREVSHAYENAAKFHFGSWADACRKAGFEPNHGNRATAGEALETLRDFYVLNGRVPRAVECASSARLYDPCVYRRLFGGFKAAVKAAGLGLAAQGVAA